MRFWMNLRFASRQLQRKQALLQTLLDKRRLSTVVFALRSHAVASQCAASELLASEAASAVKSHATNTVKCVLGQLESANAELDMWGEKASRGENV